MGKTQTQSEHPTFESVWAMIQKTAEENEKEYERRQKEDERRQKEDERRQKEAERRQKEAERRQEKAEREMEEIRREIKETERMVKKSVKENNQIIKENGRQMGYLNNRFGQMIEHLVAPNIKEKFNALGFNFDHISQDHEITDNGRHLAEIDLLLENGDIAIAVEVKSRPLLKDVDEHIRRMEILRRKADAKNDKRKYLGAIAGAILSNAVRNYAHKTGFYLIEQAGDTIRINIPEGFKPREW